MNHILIIHSGGDSRRLPHCSATGKLFARVPRELPDGRASTIFDEFLISLSGLEEGSPPGVLIAAGDVLLVFDHLQLRGAFRRSGVIGVAAAAPAELGTQHSVYASGGEGGRCGVRLSPQAHARRIGSSVGHCDPTEQCKSTPGWSGWTRRRLASWWGLPQSYGGKASEGSRSKVEGATFDFPPYNLQPVSLNLYGDLLLPLAATTTFDSYLSDASDGPSHAGGASRAADHLAAIARHPFCRRTPATGRVRALRHLARVLAHGGRRPRFGAAVRLESTGRSRGYVRC